VKNQRKKFWIDRFQTLLFVRIAVYCLLYQVAVWLLLVVWGQSNAAFAAVVGETPLGNSLVRGLLVLLLLAPILTCDVIKFAHRLVGPMYRFRKTIQAIAADEPVELVRLRDGDFLQEFRDDFNEMLKVLEAKGYVILKPGESANKSAEPELAATAPASGGPDR
jgi:hypothetical protein